MNRTFVLFAALTLATVAGAAETVPKPEPGTSSPAPGTSKLSPPTTKKAKPKPLTQKEQQVLDTKNAKAAFMSAVGACTRPDMCDPKSPSRNRDMVQLITETEKRFMDACQTCAKPEVCEAERAKIRDGRGRYGSNPCK